MSPVPGSRCDRWPACRSSTWTSRRRATRPASEKRLFDIAAGLALLILSPLMLVVALMIKLEDRGLVLQVPADRT